MKRHGHTEGTLNDEGAGDTEARSGERYWKIKRAEIMRDEAVLVNEGGRGGR